MVKRGAQSVAPKRAASAIGSARSAAPVPAKKVRRSVKTACPSQGASSDEPSEHENEDSLYDPHCEGHTKCVVCSASSRTVAWAASKANRGSSDARPLGNLCGPCYQIFELKRSKSLNSLEDFVAKAASSAAFRASIETAKQVQSGSATKAFPTETVDDCLSTELEVCHPYIILSEREVLRGLNKTHMSRLPKYLVKDLTSIDLPSRSDPSTTEKNFIFKNPSRPFRELLVKQSVTLAHHRERMPSSAQCFENQGDLVLAREAPNVLPATALADAFDKSLLNTLPSVSEFVAKTEQKDQKAATKKDSGPCHEDDGDFDMRDDGGDECSDISGPLASLYSSASKAERPLVPSFSTPPGKRLGRASSPAASVCGSASAASAACGFDDDDGEDDTVDVVRLEGDLIWWDTHLIWEVGLGGECRPLDVGAVGLFFRIRWTCLGA